MSRKSGNPLLSSFSSSLDDLPSVLMPSLPVLETTTDYKIRSSNENILSPEISLQPHLSPNLVQINNSIESSIKSGDVRKTEEAANSFIGPPKIPNQAESFLRKGPSKYLVPPEINSQKKPGNPSLPNFPLCSAQISLPSLQKPIDNISNTDSNTDSFPNFSMMPASFEAMAENPPLLYGVYHPVIPHWFFNERKQSVSTWKPFSVTDSLNLEESFRQGNTTIVSTDGGRYDVNVMERLKSPVYWESEPFAVRRCSWFRKGFAGPLPVPYIEEDAIKLEEEYKDAMTSGKWHRQVVLSGGEIVMFNSPTSIQHYLYQESSEFSNTASMTDTQQTPQVVRRGADDFTLPECAAEKVDHLLFIIHGIGNFCDLRFRSVEDCVDDFRKLGEVLLAGHFKESIELGRVGRIEVLPISWHKALHSDATGIDKKLKLITLRSIPKFREFTNDTLLDVLFFTSPVYGQHIMDAVASEMERLLSIFKDRNPTYGGQVSVGGHSLGTVILFDLLHHQKPEEDVAQKEDMLSDKENDWVKVDSKMVNSSTSRSKVNFEMGSAGTGQPAINYPQLSFKPQAFFLMGSPVGMFITIRGIDALAPDFRLPTCDRVFNIFHPFDPVAYRIETLIDPSLNELRPMLIPHHKGRKRMHLELKDTIERVGLDIKNRIVDSIQATWNAMYQLYSPLNQVIEEELLKSNEMTEAEPVEPAVPHVTVGKLNGGRRIDYVLQEKPYESFTEYIFALQAHLTYWTSEDTLLMILKELYSIEDIHSDVVLRAQREISSVATGTAITSATGQSETSSSIPITTPPSVPFAAALPNRPFMPNAFTMPPSVPPPTLGWPPGSTPITTAPSMDQPSHPLPRIDSEMPPAIPRMISGRPVFDPSLKPTVMGVDPTASPAGSIIGPPPILPKMSFKRK